MSLTGLTNLVLGGPRIPLLIAYLWVGTHSNVQSHCHIRFASHLLVLLVYTAIMLAFVRSRHFESLVMICADGPGC